MDEHIPKTKTAERLWSRPGGATMREIIAATGEPQYNELKRLAARGYSIRKVKEGNETRYFADPPAAPSFEATVTSKGQVTIPREVRAQLRLRNGQKLKFTIDDRNRVVMMPAELSIQRLFGVLGKPPRRVPIEEMDEAIRRAVVERYRRAVGGKRR
jgi:antitoxin PrlF